MHFIRLVLLSIFFLFLVITGISLFIPSHVRISRATNLSAVSGSVLQQVGDVTKWKNWYPGLSGSEPITFSIVDSTRMILQGTTITLKEKSDSGVIAEYQTASHRPVISTWKLIRYSQSDSLTLQWYMDFHLHWYPWEKFFSLVYDKMYGSQMEVGLNNLKKITTSQ
jgi:hypothetical protein